MFLGEVQGVVEFSNSMQQTTAESLLRIKGPGQTEELPKAQWDPRDIQTWRARKASRRKRQPFSGLKAVRSSTVGQQEE